MLDRAVALLEAWCDEIVVTAPPAHPLSVPHGARGVARRIDDIPGAAGPIAGLVAGLQACPYERAVALAVDFPLMRPGSLKWLLERLPGRNAVLPAPDGVPQPLAAAYGPGAAEILGRKLSDGERSVVIAVRALDPLLIGDAELARLEGGLESFLNVNAPEDRLRAEALLRAREPAREAS